MSWSNEYRGPRDEIMAQAEAQAEPTKQSLPDFEQGDVDAAHRALQQLLEVVPDGAHVIADVSGHGWRGMDGRGEGELRAALRYVLPPAAEAATAPAEDAASR